MHAASPGQVVGGRYRVTAEPAGGALPALDLRTGETVLLRALELPELLTPGQLDEDPDPEYGERVARRVAARVQAAPGHARLLHGSEVFAEGELLWTAEERPPGSPLEGPLPPYRAAEIAADLASALRALHASGVVHGNVSAPAVLVCEDGAALLGGLLPGAAEEALCEELGGPVPRRVYEARAVLLGARAERWAPDAGPESDCWALGVLLHRLLTGHAPYPEHDLTALLTAVRDGAFEVSPGCGPLLPLVERLLDPDRSARPTAAQAGHWLTALLASAPEPYPAEPTAPPLPVRRPKGPLVPRQRGAVQAHGRHAGARPLVPPALLGPLLVGGVLLALVAALAAVVAFAG
ncbi:protein kinase [Kitasatospora sp. McL0602]|uniref:protein kinase n=1 Tax=Kitasatospora sp. McL0602 TaxID=3439530 RepID=UPI003F8976ED